MTVVGTSETNITTTTTETGTESCANNNNNNESVSAATTSVSITVSPSSSTTTVASPSGKRSRDPEDEVYVDNLHSHKRYLSEIMASSLNGLSVGDPENLMDSPARSDSMFYLRDELPLQYSPMSEDLDECRYYESNACSPSQPDSQPTSPVSPYRFQRLAASTFAPGPSSYPGGPPMTPSQARQRGSEPEGRFPSSPSDICHSADLRRAALMRSVQMRTQPMGSSSQFDASSSPMQEAVQPCSFIKSLVQEIDNECPVHEKSCRVLSMDIKGDYEAAD